MKNIETLKRAKEAYYTQTNQPLERISEETPKVFTNLKNAVANEEEMKEVRERGQKFVNDVEEEGLRVTYYKYNGKLYFESLENIEVEPLQNGGREVEEVKEQLRRELPIGAYTDLYEEVTDNKEERILGYVTCGERVLDDYARIVAVMLSQSKKEGTFNMAELKQLKKLGEELFVMGYKYEDKEIEVLEKIDNQLESLTNQKKDI